MTNPVRHGIGAVIGVIVTPVAWLLIALGANPLLRSTSAFMTRVSFTGTILPMLFLLVAGALLGLLASTFVSPAGAVIAGAVNLLAGIAYPLLVRQMFDVTSWLPSHLSLDVSTSGLDGLYLVIGAALLISAAPPARWRPRTPPATVAPTYAPPAPPIP